MATTGTRGTHDALNLREVPTSARNTAKASYFAGKNRSFPILKPEDVAAAARAIGRAGEDNFSPDQLKANIIRIAKRKGAAFVAQLPKAWRTSAEKTASFSPFLSAIELAEKQGDSPRTSWVQIARTGEFYDPRYGDFTITQHDLASMVDNFKTGRYPQNPTELAFDYNHGTSRPADEDQGKASGWLKDLALRADGDELWGLVEWTERAASLIDAKEYRFVSATFSFEYTNSNGGESIGPTLLAAALTNRPVIHGMEPVSLALAEAGAVRLADAGGYDEDELAEQLFSFDEIRRRVQNALTGRYGCPYPYTSAWDAPYRGVYLVDLFDGVAIFCEAQGGKFRVSYVLGTDGSVTFTDEPVEVRVSYEPLTDESADDDAALEQTMSTIKVKDAKGVEVELAQETVLDLAKAHAPKPEGSVELAALQKTVETQGATIAELKTKNEQLELAAKTENATRAVDGLVREGKLDPKDRQAWFDLALGNPESFATLSATLAPKREMHRETGSGADHLGSNAPLDLAVAEELKANPRLTREQAYARALEKNPKLYDSTVQ